MVEKLYKELDDGSHYIELVGDHAAETGKALIHLWLGGATDEEVASLGQAVSTGGKTIQVGPETWEAFEFDVPGIAQADDPMPDSYHPDMP